MRAHRNGIVCCGRMEQKGGKVIKGE